MALARFPCQRVTKKGVPQWFSIVLDGPSMRPTTVISGKMQEMRNYFRGAQGRETLASKGHHGIGVSFEYSVIGIVREHRHSSVYQVA